MTQKDGAIILVLDHVKRAIVIADLAGLIDVGINLNQAMVALGHPGVAPAESDPSELAIIEARAGL